MSEPTKVYLVAIGEHSDFSIAAAFSSKHRADGAAKLIGGEVNEYLVDPDGYVDPGLDFWELWLDRSGGITGPMMRSRLKGGDDKDHTARQRKGRIYLHTELDYPGRESGYWALHWEGYAKSKENAICKSNEIRWQILAGQRPIGVDMGKN